MSELQIENEYKTEIQIYEFLEKFMEEIKKWKQKHLNI